MHPDVKKGFETFVAARHSPNDLDPIWRSSAGLSALATGFLAHYGTHQSCW
jgi:hypothetical protein